jgi:GT2 family glycosyltransferase
MPVRVPAWRKAPSVSLQVNPLARYRTPSTEEESEAMQVTVAICSFNAQHYLQACLDSLVAQSRQPDEVLVIDGGSKDGSLQLLELYRERYGWIRWQSQQGGPGLAVARNEAIESATCELISFLDVDARADSDWVARVLETFESRPDVAGIGGPGREASQGPPDDFRGVYYQQTWGTVPFEPARFLFGLNSHYRRAVLLSAKGFDVRFLSSGEDVELGLRLTSLGHRLIYEPTIVVTHARVDTWQSLYKMVDRWIYYGKLAEKLHGQLPSHSLLFLTLRWAYGCLRWSTLQAPQARYRPSGWWRRPYLMAIETRAWWRAQQSPL